MTFRRPRLLASVAVVATLATGGLGYSSGHSRLTSSAHGMLSRVSGAGVVTLPPALGANGELRPAVRPLLGGSPTGTPDPTAGFVALPPARIMDTRGNLGATGPVGPAKTVSLQVDGEGGVPASGVTAVVLNVTVTGPTAAGYVTVYPDGGSRPTTSNLNFTAGETVPNLVVAPVGADGKVDFFNAVGSVQLVADVSGYYTPGSTTYVTAVTNSQLLWNSSYSFATSPTSYTEYFTRYCDFSVPAITQSVLDTGSVQVFFNPNPLANTNQWLPLPYSFLDASGNFNYVVGYATSVGQVELDLFFQQIVAGATIPSLSTYTFPTYDFKVVVTP
jgi:hypothetical protein